MCIVLTRREERKSIILMNQHIKVGDQLWMKWYYLNPNDYCRNKRGPQEFRQRTYSGIEICCTVVRIDRIICELKPIIPNHLAHYFKRAYDNDGLIPPPTYLKMAYRFYFDRIFCVCCIHHNAKTTPDFYYQVLDRLNDGFWRVEGLSGTQYFRDVSKKQIMEILPIEDLYQIVVSY